MPDSVISVVMARYLANSVMRTILNVIWLLFGGAWSTIGNVIWVIVAG